MLQSLLSVFFPIHCAKCGIRLPAHDRYRLCPVCFDLIHPIGDSQCVVCGRLLPDGGAHCFDCLRKPLPLRIRSYAPFDDALRPIIYKFKYQNQPHLSRILGRFLHIAFQRNDFLAQTDIIIPVPSHWSRRFSRGYDHAGLLAKELSRCVEIPVNNALCYKYRRTPPQMKLSRAQRLNNLTNAFLARDSSLLEGKSILLVDDVCTTGATLSACAAALLKAGAGSVSGLTVARD